ncbi:MAG: hypothetical protein R2731_07500 [Nocardioides sp.]
MARRLGILSILALGLAMSGLSGHQADTAAAAETAPMTLKVVLLGDSYSAGNGARDFDGKSAYFGPSPCHRSHVNWSERYVAWLTAQGYHVTFLNRACSDGVTKDLVTPRQMDVTTFLPDRFGTDEEMLAQARADDPCNDGAYPDEQYWEYGLGGISNLGERYLTCTRFLKAQTDAIGPDTDLVLFTNGGNDIKFSDIVKQCFVIGSRSPGDCREKVNYARDHFAGAMEGVQTAIDKMRSNGLRDEAKVVYVGYPLLAQDNGYDLTSWFGLGSDNYQVADEGARWASRATGNRPSSSPTTTSTTPARCGSSTTSRRTSRGTSPTAARPTATPTDGSTSSSSRARPTSASGTTPTTWATRPTRTCWSEPAPW